MYWFLLFLIPGFISNLASAFTTTFSEKWGRKTGTALTIVLRDIMGIPVWAIGLVLAIRESSEWLYEVALPVQIIGWSVISIGAVVIIIALISIRIKAAAPSTGDSLVRKGIYSMVRHPIHSGTFLEFAGLFILKPSLQVGIACVIGVLWILLQSRFEEKDLIKRIPEYKDYMIQVPRFFPYLLKKNRDLN
jgi:protein-S-isoprenylcysteine O-methyltransferase Ste14